MGGFGGVGWRFGCDGVMLQSKSVVRATGRWLLLEVLELVYIIHGLFVGMNSALTRLVNDQE